MACKGDPKTEPNHHLFIYTLLRTKTRCLRFFLCKKLLNMVRLSAERISGVENLDNDVSRVDQFVQLVPNTTGLTFQKLSVGMRTEERRTGEREGERKEGTVGKGRKERRAERKEGRVGKGRVGKGREGKGSVRRAE